MKGITLHQPWASLIACGYKRFETRSWKTSYRGQLLIHAAKRFADEEGRDVVVSAFKHWKNPELPRTLRSFPYQAIVATCELTNCIPMNEQFINQQTDLELLVGCWKVGRFAWQLENICPVTLISTKGYQGLWNVSENLKLNKFRLTPWRSEVTPMRPETK